MKKLNVLFGIVLVGFLVLFSGCSSSTDDGTKTSGLSIGKGTASSGGVGVGLSFADGNPPAEMIEGQPVTFAFVFNNYQEHEVSDLRVKAKGFESGYVTGLDLSDHSVNTLPRATETTGPGVFSGYVVSGVRVEGFNEKYNFNPTFDYCYSAKTSFIEQVCVPSTKNQCDTAIDKSSKQNGPLSVKIDRISSVSDKVRIDFSVSNAGSGQVVNECFKIDDYANAYELLATLGSSQGSCQAISGQNIIGGKSNFYCEFSRSGDESYASQVSVELSYKYQQSVQKKILVKDLNSGYQ